ncbi:hypothetical protein B566_EDAN018938, partial [Ephemera danica]
MAVADEGFVNVTFDNSPKDGSKGIMMGFVLANKAKEFSELSETQRKTEIHPPKAFHSQYYLWQLLSVPNLDEQLQLSVYQKFQTGKKSIGWDEILEGGLAPGAAVMSWRGEKGGIEAARQGHEVVMTPTTYCYIDYMQGDSATEAKVYASLRLNKTYSYEPIVE